MQTFSDYFSFRLKISIEGIATAVSNNTNKEFNFLISFAEIWIATKFVGEITN